MGYWGLGIFQSNETCDVRDEFIRNLEMGKTPKEATQITLGKVINEQIPRTDWGGDYAALTFISLAATQIEKKCLQDDIRKNTIEVLELGADLKIWSILGKENYETRKIVLDELKEELLNYKN